MAQILALQAAFGEVMFPGAITEGLQVGLIEELQEGLIEVQAWEASFIGITRAQKPTLQ